MKIPKKYIQITALAMSLSGSILLMAYVAFQLSDQGVIRKEISFGFLVFYVFYVLYMMVRYAISKKD